MNTQVSNLPWINKIAAQIHQPVVNHNTFTMYDKAMEIVDVVLGEDLGEVFKISVVNQVCKVKFPLYVSLLPLQFREDITVDMGEDFTVITIH